MPQMDPRMIALFQKSLQDSTGQQGINNSLQNLASAAPQAMPQQMPQPQMQVPQPQQPQGQDMLARQLALQRFMQSSQQ